MNLARIVGRVVATHKDPGLAGRKLLVLRPLDESMKESGESFVAVDAAGAGAAEVVIFVRGREAAHALSDHFNPADAAIVAQVDRLEGLVTE